MLAICLDFLYWFTCHKYLIWSLLHLIWKMKATRCPTVVCISIIFFIRGISSKKFTDVEKEKIRENLDGIPTDHLPPDTKEKLNNFTSQVTVSDDIGNRVFLPRLASNSSASKDDLPNFNYRCCVFCAMSLDGDSIPTSCPTKDDFDLKQGKLGQNNNISDIYFPIMMANDGLKSLRMCGKDCTWASKTGCDQLGNDWGGPDPYCTKSALAVTTLISMAYFNPDSQVLPQDILQYSDMPMADGIFSLNTTCNEATRNFFTENKDAIRPRLDNNSTTLDEILKAAPFSMQNMDVADINILKSIDAIFMQNAFQRGIVIAKAVKLNDQDAVIFNRPAMNILNLRVSGVRHIKKNVNVCNDRACPLQEILSNCSDNNTFKRKHLMGIPSKDGQSCDYFYKGFMLNQTMLAAEDCPIKSSSTKDIDGAVPLPENAISVLKKQIFMAQFSRAIEIFGDNFAYSMEPPADIKCGTQDDYKSCSTADGGNTVSGENTDCYGFCNINTNQYLIDIENSNLATDQSCCQGSDSCMSNDADFLKKHSCRAWGERFNSNLQNVVLEYSNDYISSLFMKCMNDFDCCGNMVCVDSDKFPHMVCVPLMNSSNEYEMPVVGHYEKWQMSMGEITQLLNPVCAAAYMVTGGLKSCTEKKYDDSEPYEKKCEFFENVGVGTGRRCSNPYGRGGECEEYEVCNERRYCVPCETMSSKCANVPDMLKDDIIQAITSSGNDPVCSSTSVSMGRYMCNVKSAFKKYTSCKEVCEISCDQYVQDLDDHNSDFDNLADGFKMCFPNPKDRYKCLNNAISDLSVNEDETEEFFCMGIIKLMEVVPRNKTFNKDVIDTCEEWFWKKLPSAFLKMLLETEDCSLSADHAIIIFEHFEDNLVESVPPFLTKFIIRTVKDCLSEFDNDEYCELGYIIHTFGTPSERDEFAAEIQIDTLQKAFDLHDECKNDQPHFIEGFLSARMTKEICARNATYFAEFIQAENVSNYEKLKFVDFKNKVCRKKIVAFVDQLNDVYFLMALSLELDYCCLEMIYDKLDQLSGTTFNDLTDEEKKMRIEKSPGLLTDLSSPANLLDQDLIEAIALKMDEKVNKGLPLSGKEQAALKIICKKIDDDNQQPFPEYAKTVSFFSYFSDACLRKLSYDTDLIKMICDTKFASLDPSMFVKMVTKVLANGTVDKAALLDIVDIKANCPYLHKKVCKTLTFEPSVDGDCALTLSDTKGCFDNKLSSKSCKPFFKAIKDSSECSMKKVIEQQSSRNTLGKCLCKMQKSDFMDFESDDLRKIAKEICQTCADSLTDTFGQTLVDIKFIEFMNSDDDIRDACEPLYALNTDFDTSSEPDPELSAEDLLNMDIEKLDLLYLMIMNRKPPQKRPVPSYCLMGKYLVNEFAELGASVEYRRINENPELVLSELAESEQKQYYQFTEEELQELSELSRCLLMAKYYTANVSDTLELISDCSIGEYQYQDLQTKISEDPNLKKTICEWEVEKIAGFYIIFGYNLEELNNIDDCTEKAKYLFERTSNKEIYRADRFTKFCLGISRAYLNQLEAFLKKTANIYVTQLIQEKLGAQKKKRTTVQFTCEELQTIGTATCYSTDLTGDILKAMETSEFNICVNEFFNELDCLEDSGKETALAEKFATENEKSLYDSGSIANAKYFANGFLVSEISNIPIDADILNAWKVNEQFTDAQEEAILTKFKNFIGVDQWTVSDLIAIDYFFCHIPPLDVPSLDYNNVLSVLEDEENNFADYECSRDVFDPLFTKLKENDYLGPTTDWSTADINMLGYIAASIQQADWAGMPAENMAGIREDVISKIDSSYFEGLSDEHYAAFTEDQVRSMTSVQRRIVGRDAQPIGDESFTDSSSKTNLSVCAVLVLFSKLFWDY